MRPLDQAFTTRRVATQGRGRLGSWLLALVVGSRLLVARADPFQWRPGLSMRVFEHAGFEAFVYQEAWINDGGPRFAYYQLSPRLRYRVFEPLAVGLNYSFIETEKPIAIGDDEWTDQHRLEFELTPQWKWPSGLRVSARNRFEVRWIEERPDVNYRTRHTVEVGYPVRLPPPFEGAFSGGEVFYDWSRMRLSEYRVSPCGVDLRLSSRGSVRVYYTWRQVEVGNNWAASHVLWTVLNVRLD